MTLTSDRALVGDTRREADHAAGDRRGSGRSRVGLSRLAWRRHRYWILPSLAFLRSPSGLRLLCRQGRRRAVVRRFGASRPRSARDTTASLAR
jgi:hypothetical protein